MHFNGGVKGRNAWMLSNTMSISMGIIAITPLANSGKRGQMMLIKDGVLVTCHASKTATLSSYEETDTRWVDAVRYCQGRLDGLLFQR